jgi:transcriptional regulator with XRE-family HTH domain
MQTMGRRKPEPTTHEIFGANLRQRREVLELSQGELAERIGCSRVNISNAERGAQGVTLVRFVALCRELECSPDEMLEGAV